MLGFSSPHGITETSIPPLRSHFMLLDRAGVDCERSVNACARAPATREHRDITYHGCWERERVCRLVSPGYDLLVSLGRALDLPP